MDEHRATWAEKLAALQQLLNVDESLIAGSSCPGRGSSDIPITVILRSFPGDTHYFSA